MQPFHQTRLGDYLLTEHLARGGMADVYRARRVGPAGFERTVVIKRIRDIYYEEPAFVKMFINEAKLASRLSHPNIAQVYELGELEGDLFIVMEYVRGVDLHQVIRALKAPVPPGVSAFVAREVCRGLAHAHAQVDASGAPAPIIHRDIAPNNVVIALDGQVKIVDFGIAKALDSQRDVTAIGALKGRFGYMAPEQSEGAATPQSDLFSTGVILHEMLTRRRLFKGSDDLDTLTRMRHMPITRPSEVVPEVPPDLEAIVMRALSREPAARHPSASAMAKELDGYLARIGFSVEDMAEFMATRFPQQPLQAERASEAEATPSPVISLDEPADSSSSLHPGVVIHPRPAVTLPPLPPGAVPASGAPLASLPSLPSGPARLDTPSGTPRGALPPMASVRPPMGAAASMPGTPVSVTPSLPSLLPVSAASPAAPASVDPLAATGVFQGEAAGDPPSEPLAPAVSEALVAAAAQPPVRTRIAYGVIGFSLVAGAAVAVTLASRHSPSPPPAPLVAAAPAPSEPAAAAPAAAGEGTTAPSAPAPSVGSVAAAPAVPEAAPEVRVQIDTVPSGARVFRGESYLGKTPLAVARAASDPGPVALTFSLPGYQDRSYALEAAAGPSVTVELEAIDSSHARHRSSSGSGYRGGLPVRPRPAVPARAVPDAVKEDRAPRVDVVAD